MIFLLLVSGSIKIEANVSYRVFTSFFLNGFRESLQPLPFLMVLQLMKSLPQDGPPLVRPLVAKHCQCLLPLHHLWLPIRQQLVTNACYFFITYPHYIPSPTVGYDFRDIRGSLNRA